MRQERCGEDCLDFHVEEDLDHLGEENDDFLLSMILIFFFDFQICTFIDIKLAM
jgi:hypothetical protein